MSTKTKPACSNNRTLPGHEYPLPVPFPSLALILNIR